MSHFNPRSREGSDEESQLIQNLFRISIHAPARGATALLGALTSDEQISIHAPARGATPLNWASTLFCVFQSTLPRGERRLFFVLIRLCRHDFNPRSREGSDVLDAVQLRVQLTISIHAPARGATSSTDRLQKRS